MQRQTAETSERYVEEHVVMEDNLNLPSTMKWYIELLSNVSWFCAAAAKPMHADWLKFHWK